MGTKLLPKQEIVLLKGAERKREIDEGLKLAKKIDLLRQTASEEEANLKKFREESLKVIKEEMSKIITERDGIIIEIVELKQQKNDLKSQIESIKNY